MFRVRNKRRHMHVIPTLIGFLFGWVVVRIVEVVVLPGRCSGHPHQTVSADHAEDTYARGNPRSPTWESSRPEELLLVGVMTTRRNLATRAAAIMATWGQEVPGRVLFYIGDTRNRTTGEKSEQGNTQRNASGIELIHNLPVVQLPGISDETYPPQKKCFAMLRHMHAHFGAQYHWFMRADDDLLLRPEDLGQFLASVNSSRLWYLGQPGTGVPKERGKLGLRDGTPYCMGGPGVLLSAPTLGLLVPHLAKCAHQAVTSHEDTELGRCVQQFVNISCSKRARVGQTWIQMKKLFYQNYREKNGSFTGALDPKIFSALTLHPVKDARQMYRLYVLLKTKQLQLVQLHQQTLLTTLNGFEEIAERIVVRKHVEHTRHDGKRSDGHLPFSHGKDVKGSNERKDALLRLGFSDISDFTNSQRRLLHVEENNSRENRSVGLRRSDLRRRPQGQRTPSAQAIRSESDRSRIVREAREEIRQLELRTPAKDLIQSPRTTRRDQNVTQARTGGRDSDSVREKPERESPHASSESLPGPLAPSASKAGHSVTSPETFFKVSKPLLDSETTTRSFTVQDGPTKESTTPTPSFLQNQSSVTLHVNSSVTSTVYKNVKLKQNPLAAASEELVWDFVGPGNTFFSVSSLVHPALRMASQRASKHLSNFQESLPTTKEAPGRIVGQYQSMSVSRGLHHILVTSADNKTRSFLLTTRFEPLQLREVEDVEDISTQSKVGLGSNKLQVTEIRHQDVVSQHSLKSGKDMANGTSHPAGVLLGEKQRQSHSDLWILLPLYGRYKAYARFLQYLSASVRSYPGEVHLRVALFPDPWRNHEKSWTSTEQHRQVSKNNSSAQNLDITLVTMNVTFSRARALHDLASEMDEQALLVLMDVDLVLTTNFLFRVARNAGPGRVYFPAYFAQYNPETVCYGEAPNCTRDWSDFSRDSGTWRYFSYGVAALTAGDLRRAGGLDTTIKGWGKEDVDLYSKCVTKGLHIMRALDPGLVHVHHRRSCDPTLAPDQLRMCRSSLAALYGSIHKLAAMVMDNETESHV